jgi:osmotically inducible lipoprotein OsmB
MRLSNHGFRQKSNAKTGCDASQMLICCVSAMSLFFHFTSHSSAAMLIGAMFSNGGVLMKKFLVISAVVLAVSGLAACNSPGERAAGGAVLGGAAGAVIGGLATGRVGGAVAGGVIGAAGGAIVGAATTPAQPQCPGRAPYLRRDAYGELYCSPR